jgi:hypothetical protein
VRAAALERDERVRLLEAVRAATPALLAIAGPLGCAGAILALANAEPEQCVTAFLGDVDAQRKLAPAHLAANVRFPAGLKELVATRFGTSRSTRA